MQIDLDGFLYGVYHPHQMKALTPRQREILDFIEHYLESRKIPPTLREIAAFLNVKHTSTVYRHLQRIAKKGYLILKGGRRGWVLVKPFREGLRIPLYRDLPLPPQGPLFGPPQEWLELPEWMVQDAPSQNALFALRWSSSEPSASPLQPGDYVIVQAESRPQNPDTWILLYLPEQGLVLRQVIADHPDGLEVLPLPPATDAAPQFLRAPIVLGRVLCILRFPT